MKKLITLLVWIFNGETNVKSLNEEGITILNRLAYRFYCKKYKEGLFKEIETFMSVNGQVPIRANYKDFVNILNIHSYWGIVGGIYYEYHTKEDGTRTFSEFPNNIGYFLGDIKTRKIFNKDTATNEEKATNWWFTFNHHRSGYSKDCCDLYLGGKDPRHLTIKEILLVWNKEAQPKTYGKNFYGENTPKHNTLNRLL